MSAILILLVVRLGFWLVAFSYDIFVFTLVFKDGRRGPIVVLDSVVGFYPFCF